LSRFIFEVIDPTNMNDDEFRHKIFEFVVEEVNINNPIELDGNPIEIVNINDTGNFPREESYTLWEKVGLLSADLPEMEKVRLSQKDELSQKIQQKSSNLKEVEKVDQQSPEEIAETKK
jgi:vacuolar-type H+-ATPase subunit I/STV1